MLKKIVNHAHVEMRIQPLDPLLIKSGQATVGGVDMSFVRTYAGGDGAMPYIPGSSLKGVMRSYAEKICRSLRETPVPVCLPYAKPEDVESGQAGQASCGLVMAAYKRGQNNTLAGCDAYRLSCPACRLFGSHNFVGRFSVSDAYCEGKPVLEIRDGVAIDRFTGQAYPGAKYDLEVLTSGEFTATIEIRNFERWQLGLVGLVLRDMEDGLVRIGFGKSRGLGRIKGTVTCFQVTYYHRPVNELSGLSSLCPDADAELYGFFREQDGAGSPLPKARRVGLRYEHDITESWREALEPAVGDLAAYVRDVDWPGALKKFVGQGV